jgi:hypothetical protein
MLNLGTPIKPIPKRQNDLHALPGIARSKSPRIHGIIPRFDITPILSNEAKSNFVPLSVWRLGSHYKWNGLHATRLYCFDEEEDIVGGLRIEVEY